MNAQEFKKWLAARGCTFETKKGGSGHIIVRRGGKKSELPMRTQGTRYRPCECDQEAAGVEVMLEYGIELTSDDNGTFLVTCPQLPIVTTFGDSEASAMHHAVDAIETALASMIEDGENIPYPDQKGGVRVRLPLLTALKVHLYWALRATGITRAELARRLQWNRESVDRLFRLDHRSRLEQIEAAFAALGRSIDLEVHQAA